MKQYVCGILLFFSAFLLPADNIRGPLRAFINISDDSSFSSEIRIKLEDLIAFDLPDGKKDYLQGIEIEVKIPSSLMDYRNSCAVFLYNNCSPTPLETGHAMRTFQGTQLGFELIPSRSLIYYRLSHNGNDSFQQSPDTVIFSKPFTFNSLPLIAAILPVMKGIPGIVSSSEFRVRARGIFTETGSARIKPLATEEGIPWEEVLISIDGESIPLSLEEITLPTGLHTLTLWSETYKPQNITFGVESNKETIIELPFEKLVPRIYIEGPTNTEIYLDGNKIDYHEGLGIELPEGDHTILFKIGDYRLSKHFSVENGKEYFVSLFMDVIVQER